VLTQEAQAAPSQATTSFTPRKIAKGTQLKPGETLAFDYPDSGSPCLLIRTSAPTQFGVGPNRDLVAYSTFCPHQGFPLVHDAKAGVMKCRSHFSTFDADNGGKMICGQATKHLTRIELVADAEGKEVTAVGVAGLIYGRVNNKLS
jgi:arsenite oxidase small subunit